MGPKVQCLDLGKNGHLRFEVGASFENPSNIEVRGSTQVDFTLCETGFSTLDFWSLYDENVVNGAIYISIYMFPTTTIAHGIETVRVDFISHSSTFNDEFNPTINFIKRAHLYDLELTFVKDTSKLILTFTP